MSAPWLCQLRLSTISIQPFCCYLCYVCPSTGLFWLTVWWGKCLWCFCVCLWNGERWVLNKTEHGRRLCILPVSVGYFSNIYLKPVLKKLNKKVCAGYYIYSKSLSIQSANLFYCLLFDVSRIKHWTSMVHGLCPTAVVVEIPGECHVAWTWKTTQRRVRI